MDSEKYTKMKNVKELARDQLKPVHTLKKYTRFEAVGIHLKDSIPFQSVSEWLTKCKYMYYLVNKAVIQQKTIDTCDHFCPTCNSILISKFEQPLPLSNLTNERSEI